MSYPVAKVFNSTNYPVYGRVEYVSIFCSDDNCGVIQPLTRWVAKHRGVCLIKKVSATIQISNKETIEATPYTSSGTSYSSFAVVQVGTNQFAVTRLVNAMEDEIPADYVEPTEKQKD